MESSFKIAGVKVAMPGTDLSVELGEVSGSVKYDVAEIREGLGFVSAFAKFLMAEVVPVVREVRKEDQQRRDQRGRQASKEAGLREVKAPEVKEEESYW